MILLEMIFKKIYQTLKLIFNLSKPLLNFLEIVSNEFKA